MSQLAVLRRHIKSIEKTRKITYAMRLIAMSQYAKLERQRSAIDRHASELAALLGTYASEGLRIPPFLLTEKNDSHPLVILVSSSKGLCGGFNNAVLRFMDRSVRFKIGQQPVYITVGADAQNWAITHHAVTMLHIESLTVSNLATTARNIAQHITHNHRYSSVNVVSNHFRNFFVQQPRHTVVYPLAAAQETQAAARASDMLLWEQKPELVMATVHHLYLESMLLRACYQSLLAEQSARFVAMDSATSSAEKILDSLRLSYNKSRQAAITKELAEFAAGMSAQ